MKNTLLFYPFEKELLSRPDDQALCAAIECDYASDFEDIKNLKVFNSFKPKANKWKGYDEAPLEANYYDYIFLSVPKQKLAAADLIAKSLSTLKEEGMLIALAANDAGGKTLEKMVQKFGVTTNSLSKSKHRIVMAKKENLNTEVVEEAMIEGGYQEMAFEDDIYITKPGIFGWDKIDQGSYLLMQAMTEPLSGHGADFGCGYGYLSRSLLDHNNIKSLIAIDADFHALQCAQANIEDKRVTLFWEDLTDFTLNDLDFIVMNPPFHMGKKINSDVGKKFIENAAMSLKKGGVLYMVANAHLPYENILETYFSHIDKLKEQHGFKVYKGVK